MLNLSEIHKPKTIEDAIKLLRQPGTVALAGGTQLIASQNTEVRAVVDLSALDLSRIRDQDGAVSIGATTTLADVSDSPMLRGAIEGVLAQAAHNSAASILRNQGTIAGTLITELDGILATTLLALDAQIVCIGDKRMDVAIADFLVMLDHFTMGSLITEIVIPAVSLGKRARLETVARTPSDRPIVTVCACLRIDGDTARDVRVGMGGVGEKAVRANETERYLEGKRPGISEIEQAGSFASQGLAPRGDYRGSVEYRKEMAVVLTRRALAELTK